MPEKSTAIVFCRSCAKVIKKVPDVPEDMKGIVEDLAHFKSFCADSEHNTFRDCNFNIKIKWFDSKE